MDVVILTETEIRSLIDAPEALSRARSALAKLAIGEATLPNVLFLDLPMHRGEVHGKGAYVHGSPNFAVKIASGFYGNPERGLPVSAGIVTVFEAETGRPNAILFDNGFLTELRTGAAGAIAADLLARTEIGRAGIVGCGSQARFQLEALLGVRTPSEVVVYGRDAAAAAAYAQEMTERFGLDVQAVPTARQAVEGSDVVITVTPAKHPIVHADWIQPGTHVTAVGSDAPEKQELDVALLARATKVVADSLSQCLTQGEIHHAVAAGALAAEDVHAELGEIQAGLKPGREDEDEITVADLTGVGVLDAAMAELVTAKARADGIGRRITTSAAADA